MTTAKLLLLLPLWGFFSSWTDTLNKSILTSFPFPVTLTLFQFAVSAACGFLLLTSRLHPHQQPHRHIGFRGVFPLTLCQTLGFLFTNISMGRVAVSFTQTVKVIHSLKPLKHPSKARLSSTPSLHFRVDDFFFFFDAGVGAVVQPGHLACGVRRVVPCEHVFIVDSDCGRCGCDCGE